MGKTIIKIWGGENSIEIYNKRKEKIGIATDRDDYHDELYKLAWNLNSKGYIVNKKGGSLHKYMMGKWYGDEVVREFYNKGYIIDHINNEHYDNRISNLAFYLRTRNVAKGMYFDKESKQIRDKLLVQIHKDFSNKCYQISLVFNDFFITMREDDTIVRIYALYLLYNNDVLYSTVVNNATDIITMFQEKDVIDLSGLKYCDYEIYDEKSETLFGINLANDESNNETPCIIIDDWEFRVVHQKEHWNPARKGRRLPCELIIHN